MTTHQGSTRRREQVNVYARNQERAHSGSQLARRKICELFPQYDNMVNLAKKFTDPVIYAEDIDYLLDDRNVLDIMGV